MLLRVFGAVIIYFVVNTLLKLPFDKQFLAGTTLAAFLIRTARYAIIMFLIMGLANGMTTGYTKDTAGISYGMSGSEVDLFA